MSVMKSCLIMCALQTVWISLKNFMLIVIVGARVIMACRNLEKCVKAAEEITADTSNHDFICIKLNLASMESIKDFARDVNQRKYIIYKISKSNYSVKCFQCHTCILQIGFEELDLNGMNFESF